MAWDAIFARAREHWGASRNFRIVAGVTVGMLLLRAMLAQPVAPQPIDVSPHSGRRFEDLTEKNQQFVKESYRKILAAHERKEFGTMAEQARNVLTLVDDYNDTLSYESIARRGIDQLEEERRRRQQEERTRLVREETASFEAQAEMLYQRALSDPTARAPFQNLAAQILVRDPSNRLVPDWLRTLRELEAGEHRKRNTRELASLEIRGEGLVTKAKKDPESRAQLYEISDRIKQIDPTNTYPGEWSQKIHHAP